MIEITEANKTAILHIIEAVSQGNLASNDGESYCLYCNESVYKSACPEVREMLHAPDCPITVARKLRAEWGTPLNVYRVTCERKPKARNPAHTASYFHTWQEQDVCEIAFSPEELDPRKNEVLCESYDFRNVSIEFVRIFPL